MEDRGSESGEVVGVGGGGGPSREQKWRALVAALRSGQYAQAKHVLHSIGNGYCCLGVACEVAIAGGLQLNREPAKGSMRYWADTDGHGSSTSLPESVMTWYEIYSDNPSLQVPMEVMEKAPVAFVTFWDRRREALQGGVPTFTAAQLNDQYDFTLELIADCFEATFLPQDWEARLAQGG